MEEEYEALQANRT
jgi:hypothetical protein